MEPITIFTRFADPARVARKLRALCPAVKIDGPDDNWRTAVVQTGWWWRKQSLTLTHAPEYYAEPNWSNQMNGMRGYFAMLPDSERKQRAIALTTSFKFSLGTLFKPEFDPTGDARLEILFALARELDGVLFTPSSLRDANGRILLSAGGEDDEDPEAVWPRVLAEVSVQEPAAVEAVKQPSDDNTAPDEPPPAQRVARRALALTAVTGRAILEQEADGEDAAENYQHLLQWIGDLKLDDELEPEEWEVIQRPLGRLDNQMQVDATWRLESLVVLAWALNRFEIPPHDQLVQLNPLWMSCHFLDAEAAARMVERATLRPRKNIADLRQRLFAIHWRLRNYRLDQKDIDFAEFAETCWFGPLDISSIPLVDGDMALQGRRIDRASPDILDTAHSIATERHQAINWLWEGPNRYSEASQST